MKCTIRLKSVKHESSEALYKKQIFVFKYYRLFYLNSTNWFHFSALQCIAKKIDTPWIISYCLVMTTNFDVMHCEFVWWNIKMCTIVKWEENDHFSLKCDIYSFHHPWVSSRTLELCLYQLCTSFDLNVWQLFLQICSFLLNWNNL